MVASVCMSASESSWMSDRSRVRRADGNADGFEVVTTTLDEVSTRSVYSENMYSHVTVPLFWAPQTSQSM